MNSYAQVGTLESDRSGNRSTLSSGPSKRRGRRAAALLTYCFVFAGFVGVHYVRAQQPTPTPFKKLPPPKGAAALKNEPEVLAPWKSLYVNPHEASIGALKAAKAAAHPNSGNERAFNLFLMATRRDPTYVKPVFDLGVLCEMGERWDDALNFYQTIPQVGQDPVLTELAASEIERVKVLQSLTATPEGRRTRDFDVALMQLLNSKDDPAVAVDRVGSLSKTDKARWEASALAGELYAALDRYAEAAKSLQAAARLAPPERREQLNAASETASRQAQFQDLTNNGEKSWEDKKYDEAAALYQEAWKVDQTQIDTGIQAAVAYLMADQIKQGVAVLSLVRQNGAGSHAQKVDAMLKELIPVAEDAKQALNSGGSGSANPTIMSALERIGKAVGEIASAEVKIVARSVPALVEDPPSIESLPDPELAGADLARLSPESIFEQYRRGVPAPIDPLINGAPGQANPGTTAPADAKAAPVTPGAEQVPSDRFDRMKLPKPPQTPPPSDPAQPPPPR